MIFLQNKINPPVDSLAHKLGIVSPSSDDGTTAKTTPEAVNRDGTGPLLIAALQIRLIAAGAGGETTPAHRHLPPTIEAKHLTSGSSCAASPETTGSCLRDRIKV